MSQTLCYKIVGPTQTLSATNVSQASVTVTANLAELTNYCGFLNVGASPVVISVVPLNGNPNPIFPTVTSGPVNGFVLAPLMEFPMLIAVPQSFQASALTNSTLASQVYITPMTAL